jgi:hypothetical protein
MVGRWRRARGGATAPTSVRAVLTPLRIVPYWRIMGTNHEAGQYERLGGSLA